MFTSQVSGFCQQAGQAYRAVGNCGKLQSTLTDDSAVRLIVVDLQTPALDLSEVASLLNQAEGVPSVAYAQHVEEAMLRAATECGFDRVLTRGQFHAEIREIVNRG